METVAKPKLLARVVSAYEVLRGFKYPEKKNPRADYFNYSGSGTFRTLFTHTFTGEKNLGEIGPIKIYRLDYDALRFRSYQAFLESEIVQTIVGRYDTWVIGKGLKLEAEPSEEVLSEEGITLNTEDFSKVVEARFKLFCKSRLSSLSGMKTVNMLASQAHKNAILGGDVLVVLRYINDRIKIQLIDGQHVQSPQAGTEWFPQTLENGNRIMNGIEVTPEGKHVRYYVRNENLSFTVIDAVGAQSGLTMAYMVYGLEYRIDNIRGLPLFSAVLETVKKLDRYKEATVGSAEERQKVAYSIEQTRDSNDINPMLTRMANASGFSATDDLPADVDGNELASTVAATTNKTAFFLGIGQSLKLLESKNELYFKDFYGVNSEIICSTIEIPPNVAFSKYDANFSASRAALKDWENTLNVKRDRFSELFYQPIYDFWLHIQIMKNKIQAPGYATAYLKGDMDVLEAYRNARFIGAAVPHIDPEKEAAAERLKLGDTGASIPLTTVERATENLGGGESGANMRQYAKELEKSKKLGIKVELPPVVQPKVVPVKKKPANA